MKHTVMFHTRIRQR